MMYLSPHVLFFPPLFNAPGLGVIPLRLAYLHQVGGPPFSVTRFLHTPLIPRNETSGCWTGTFEWTERLLFALHFVLSHIGNELLVYVCSFWHVSTLVSENVTGVDARSISSSTIHLSLSLLLKTFNISQKRSSHSLFIILQEHSSVNEMLISTAIRIRKYIFFLLYSI